MQLWQLLSLQSGVILIGLAGCQKLRSVGSSSLALGLRLVRRGGIFELNLVRDHVGRV